MIKRTLFFIYLFSVLVFQSSYSSSKDLSQVDEFIQALYIDDTINLDDLSLLLTEPFDDETEKVRAIFYWIASNIEYDYEGRDNNSWYGYYSGYDILQDVFRLRKGICSGYAYLFDYMLELNDIESEIVTGYAKADIYDFRLTNTNHAWNAVKIEGAWQLFDVTWARDTVNKKIDNFYFLSKPEKFILNHFPEDTKWTLLNYSYSLEEFLHFPIYTNLFYESNFSEEQSKDGYLTAVDNYINLELKPNYECLYIAQAYDFSTNEWFYVPVINRIEEDGVLKLFVDREGNFVIKLGIVVQRGYTSTIYSDMIFYLVENTINDSIQIKIIASD